MPQPSTKWTCIGSVNGTVSKVYDQNSNLTSLTYPRNFSGGRRVIGYTYDDLDRVTEVREGSIAVADYAYAGPGRVQARRYQPGDANPMTTSYGYDEIKRVTSIAHTNILQPDAVTPVPLTFNYAFDREGNPRAEHAVHEPGTQGLDFYSYDSAYRLTNESRGAPSSLPANNVAGNPSFGGVSADARDWTLDGVTNWKTVLESVGGVGVPVTRTTNEVNEYTTVTDGENPTVSRAHDENGNLVDNGTFVFVYDALNRLVRTIRKSDEATIAVHVWDCMGRRVQHTVSDGVNDEDLRFFYSGSSLIEESDELGGLARNYVFGGMGERIQVVDNAGASVQLLFEKLSESVVAYCDSIKTLDAYYDYKVQGLVEKVTVGNDGAYFTNDDGLMTVGLGSSQHYLSFNFRLDFETGLFLGIGTVKHFDVSNGRPLQLLLPISFSDFLLQVAPQGSSKEQRARWSPVPALGRECDVKEIIVADAPWKAPWYTQRHSYVTDDPEPGLVNVAMLGPYNDPKKTGTYCNTHWIVFRGKNIQSCYSIRYVARTYTYRRRWLAGLGKGYSGPGFQGRNFKGLWGPPDSGKPASRGGGKLKHAGGFKNTDGPSIGNEVRTHIWSLTSDSPGFSSKRGISYEANFVLYFYSSITKKLKARVRYDVIINPSKKENTLYETEKKILD